MLKCSVLAVVLATVALIAGLGAGPPTPEEKRMPNVVLITLDTLRADHLSCYGYERATSPRIDAFAREATRYTRSMATSPWTLPTHASLFTGKLPREHGAHTTKVGRRSPRERPLSGHHVTLTEVLREAGYSTGAFVTNIGYLAAKYGFNQGFETYHVERVPARKLSGFALTWLREHREKPFFLFLNYMDTHRPYAAQPAHAEVVGEAPGYDGGKLLTSLYSAVMPAKGPVPTELAAQVVKQYDTAIVNLDAGIGDLLDGLREQGLHDNTLIVLVSDHGEYFGEHHLVEHSKDVYQEALFVPLIIKDPGQRKGRVVETIVSSTDVPRLMLDGFPRSWAERYHGLFTDVPGNHAVVSENYYTRGKDLRNKEWGHRFDRVRTVLFDWPLKYIRSSDGMHELYDIEADPLEARNLITVRAAEAGRLAQELRRLDVQRPPWKGGKTPPRMSEEERDRLRSLGYVGD